MKSIITYNAILYQAILIATVSLISFSCEKKQKATDSSQIEKEYAELVLKNTERKAATRKIVQEAKINTEDRRITVLLQQDSMMTDAEGVREMIEKSHFKSVKKLAALVDSQEWMSLPVLTHNFKRQYFDSLMSKQASSVNFYKDVLQKPTYYSSIQSWMNTMFPDLRVYPTNQNNYQKKFKRIKPQ